VEKIITFEKLDQFAYCNLKICKRPIKGIVLSFFGLGNTSMFKEDTPEGIFFAENGVLYVVPYYNPWSWMNKQAVAYTDEILDVLFETLALPDDTAIVSTGGSMGGLSSLVYMAYAKRTPKACVANCPVCDAVYHYTERPDLPRTMYSALYHEEGDLLSALKSISPIHLTDKLPKAEYTIFHCEKDLAVNKKMHSDRLVAAMRDAGFAVTYIPVPDRGHCDLTPEARQTYLACALHACTK